MDGDLFVGDEIEATGEDVRGERRLALAGVPQQQHGAAFGVGYRGGVQPRHHRRLVEPVTGQHPEDAVRHVRGCDRLLVVSPNQTTNQDGHSVVSIVTISRSPGASSTASIGGRPASSRRTVRCASVAVPRSTTRSHRTAAASEARSTR